MADLKILCDHIDSYEFCMNRPGLNKFFKGTGLIKSEMFCLKCSEDMKIFVTKSHSAGFKCMYSEKA